MLIIWKTLIYFVSFFVTLKVTWLLNPSLFLCYGEIWRPLSSALYTDSLFWDPFVLWCYLFACGYTREFHKGSFYATQYFILSCKTSLYLSYLIPSRLLPLLYSFFPRNAINPSHTRLR